MAKKIIYFFIFIILFFTVDIGRYAFYPNVSDLIKTNPIPTAFMQYRMDQWVDEGKQKQLTQKWVNFNQISPYLVKAVLISEDDGFWKNDGFEMGEMSQAFEKNLKAGKFVAGGSTVTQQLAKNIYLSPSKNPIRKIKEAILTYRMNKALTKRRIIELYLNCAEWGDGIFGIEAAARHYYHKSAASLSAMEAAKLASILPNPIIFQPEAGGRVVKKAALLYKIMSQRGIVIKDYNEAVNKNQNSNTDQDENETEQQDVAEQNSTEESNSSK